MDRGREIAALDPSSLPVSLNQSRVEVGGRKESKTKLRSLCKWGRPGAQAHWTRRFPPRTPEYASLPPPHLATTAVGLQDNNRALPRKNLLSLGCYLRRAAQNVSRYSSHQKRQPDGSRPRRCGEWEDKTNVGLAVMCQILGWAKLAESLLLGR